MATGAELPKVLPPQAMLPAKPPLKAWSLRNHGEKDSQIRHWLARAEYGTPAERAQIIAAIRAAGLNANDREELEDIRSRYGYRRLQY